ncbi:MAG TPA: SDR family oxidoreductase [Polyangiaceae bacterium]|jgi:NAD(P)-dependent dehydrogenase (short-subunit alcohol dehydrogenase family)
MDTSDYAGKVVIVTGGASGIGAALAKEMARAGAQVVLADRQVELAEKVGSSIRAEGGRATAVELDVRSLPAMTAVVDATVAQLGRVDYFFNNAGIGVGGEMDAYDARDWDDVFDVNLRGVAYGIQAVYPRMIAQGSGHIVNTASVAGLVAAPADGSYTATKHAVVGLSKALRIEAKRHGVRVSVLCPGVIRTPILTGGKFGRVNVPGLTEDAVLAMWARLQPMDVEVFARKAARAVARNEAIIVIPRWWKALWYLERASPALSARLWEAVLGKMRGDIDTAVNLARPPGRARSRDDRSSHHAS